MPRLPRGAWLLLGGGLGSFVVALVHLAAIFTGAPAYRRLGAPALGVLAEQGSWVPAFVTALLVVLFAVWGCYAVSAAGVIRRLPALTPVLLAIGTIYAVRGLALLPQTVAWFVGKRVAPLDLVYSAISLALGLLHLLGRRLDEER